MSEQTATQFLTLHEIVVAARVNLAPGFLELSDRRHRNRDDLVRALELLEEEVRVCLGLLGVTSLTGLTRACVAPAPPVFEPSALSAFPLLGEDLRSEPPA